MAQYRKLKTLLSDQSNELNSLVRHAQFLARSNRILQNILSTPLKKHVSIGNISDQTLIITLDSAAWATKIKLQLPDIFEKFKKTSGLHQLKHTRIKIDPFNVHATYNKADNSEKAYNGSEKANNSSGQTRNTVENPASLSSSLSTKVISQINHVANNLTDEKLKKSLLKLAKTLSDKRS